jgi:hypothetical protein
LPSNLGIDHRAIINVRWFTRKEIRFEDHISFSDEYTDMYGMPQITFHYTLSNEDGRVVHAAIVDMAKVASTLDTFLPGAEPQLLARGSSLHFQGTFSYGRKA